MCVLAAQQDNKVTEANGYSMSEETKERRRRRCDVVSGSIRPSEQLRRRQSPDEDKVQFVQQFLRHVYFLHRPCIWTNVQNFPTWPLVGKMSWSFPCGLSLSTVRVNSLTPTTPPTWALSRQEGKWDLFPCPPPVSPFLRHPWPFPLYTRCSLAGSSRAPSS